ncbi:CU044_5270 family protein [Nocardiopsis sp. NPDC049922]|uniref:CU044_5270 family protein n=1 Tax=Nocardiopsis sp. NPDC049922 TaxID=3155157 RepID=UPI0033D49E73
MNEIDHLSRVRADVPEPTAEELAVRTGWRPGGAMPARRVRATGRIPLALSGAAVLVAAAVFTFLALGPGGFPGSDSVAVEPLSPSSGGAGNDGTAMEVMAPLAEAVRSQPVDGAVWQQGLTAADAWGVGPEGDRYGVYDVREAREWTDTETGRAAYESVSTDWSLVTDRVRGAWQRDGSPSFWPEETARQEIPAPENDAGPYATDTVGYPIGDDSLSPQDLQDLPSDPDRLREMLRPEEDDEEPLDEGDTARAGFEPRPEPSIAVVTSTLNLPLPPQVRAGVYEVLAGLPGVREAEGVTEDLSGRPAVGVAYDVDGLMDGRYEERILFDPETGRLLSVERVVVEAPEWEADWAEPGDVVHYRLYETSEWNDSWPDVEDPTGG